MVGSDHQIEAIRLSGTSEMCNIPEEFPENHNFAEKNVRMDPNLKQMKLDLKKALRSPLKSESCFKLLKEISSTNPQVLIDGETPRMIPFYLGLVFEKIIAFKRNDPKSRRLSTICEILSTATKIYDVNDEGVSAVMDFVYPCLDLLAQQEEQYTVRVEANEFLNVAIKSFCCSEKNLGRVPFVEKFDEFLASAGDLELQLCMTELIHRILPRRKSRIPYAEKWFQRNPERRDDFLSIRSDEFESDSRKFVNNLNESQHENRSVYSVLCKEVYMGVQKVNCPTEDGSNGMFWTDFNLGSKSITFFVITDENDNWETVRIKQDIVVQSQILEKEESHEIVLLVQLNEPASNLVNNLKLEQTDERYVKFIYDEKNSPLTTASLLFPKDFQASKMPVSPDMIASTPKASITSNAVQFSSRSKGLSKTVSLLTPRRKKEKRESSDDSSSSNGFASSKERKREKPPSDDKKASSCDGEDDDIKFKHPIVDDDNKKQRSNESIDANPEKAVPPVGQDVSGDETMRCDDVEKHIDQNETEIEQQGEGNDLEKKEKDRQSLDESGLGKSIDSGLGKSIDNKDQSIGDLKNMDELSECLQDVSQDEPTVIHATQTLSQNDVEDKDDLYEDEDEKPLSVIAKSCRVKKDAKKSDDARDSSSGPFVKKTPTGKKTGMEESESESSTAFVKKPTKTIKAKPTAKTREIRTRAAAKKNASIGRSVSTSESEIPDKALTRSRSLDDIDKKNKLGSGYNTEDWMMGYSEAEKRTEKKKALKNARNSSQSRVSLLNTVYRENNTWDSKRKRVHLGGPWEFRCSPPAKRSPQGKILIRTAIKTYQLKKKEELKEKRKEKGIKPEKPMSRRAYKKKKEEEKSFSDIMLEVQRKCEKEPRKPHSDSDILKKARETEAESQTVVPNDEEEESTKTPKNSEKVDDFQRKHVEEIDEDAQPIPAGGVLTPPANDVDSPQFNLNEEIPTDPAAELDQNSEHVDSPHDLDIGIPRGIDASIDEHISDAGQDENGDTPRTKETEMINITYDKGEKRVHKESKSFRKSKARSNSGNLTEESMSIDIPREIESELEGSLDGSEMLCDEGVCELDDEDREQEDRELNIQTKKNQKNKKHIDVSEAHSRTKLRTESKQEIPTKKWTIKKASTDRTRGKQKRKKDEIRELDYGRKDVFLAPPNDGSNDDDGSLSSDTAFILDAFRKSSEKIIEDSDECMDGRAGMNKRSSRKQSETLLKNKMKVKSVNNRQGSPVIEEDLYHPDDELDFKLNTPKVNLSLAADSGFFDKTPSSSGKRRTRGKRIGTPGSAKSDVQGETPGGKVLRKSQRFGRLNVQPKSSRAPKQGYQSNDDRYSFRFQSEHESPDEDNIFSHSQPVSGNQGSRKRKGSHENDFSSKTGVKKRRKSSSNNLDFEDRNEVIEDMNSRDYVDDSFKTPVDSQSVPIQPRKLFQSSGHSTVEKRRKVSREDFSDDHDEDEEDDDEGEFDDERSIGEKMQTSFANLGKEVKKTIKQRQDGMGKMASETMKFIADKSDEMLSKRRSRRYAIMNEFTNRVNKYVDEHQQITARSQAIESEMFSQVKKHLKDLAEQRKAQKECLQDILKTKKSLGEAFQSMEESEMEQQRDFHNSLQKELKQYRDKAARDAQKQEFENIKRRIQAMLGMSL